MATHNSMLDILQQSATSTLAKTDLQILRASDDLYRKAAVTAGEISFREGDILTRQTVAQAMMDDFNRQGVTAITYKNGTKMPIDSYSEMAGRTMSGNAASQGSLNRYQEYGFKLFKISAHFQTCHLCVTGDTLISGPIANLGIRREYSGELIKISTASGKHLTGTPDHSVLTPNGWCSLEKLKPSNKVISETDVNGALNRRGVMPSEIQVPARIDDIVEAFPPVFRMDILASPAGSNFDSDVADSKINVIRANSNLLDKGNSMFSELGSNGSLISRIRLAFKGSCKGSLAFCLRSMVFSPPSIMSGLHKFLAFIMVPFRPSFRAGVRGNGPSFFSGSVSCGIDNTMRSGAGFDTKPLQVVTDGSVTNPKYRADLSCSFTRLVEAANFLSLCISQFSKRSLGSGFSNNLPDPFNADVEFGRQLISSLSGGVTVDDILTVERSQFNGHVYDLQTIPHWYVANSIISHNCAPWENRVVSIDGRNPKYPTLADAVSSGFSHPNCIHSYSPWKEGFPITQPRLDPAQQRLIDKHGYNKAQEIAYQAQQRQRTIERNIKKWKMREATSLDPKVAMKSTQKIKSWQSIQREHIKANTFLRRDYARESLKF